MNRFFASLVILFFAQLCSANDCPEMESLAAKLKAQEEQYGEELLVHKSRMLKSGELDEAGFLQIVSELQFEDEELEPFQRDLTELANQAMDAAMAEDCEAMTSVYKKIHVISAERWDVLLKKLSHY